MCPANKDVWKQSIIAGTDSLNEKYTMCDSFHPAFSERDDGTGYTKVLIPSSRNQSMRPRSIVFNRSNLVTDKKKRHPIGCLFIREDTTGCRQLQPAVRGERNYLFSLAISSSRASPMASSKVGCGRIAFISCSAVMPLAMA